MRSFILFFLITYLVSKLWSQLPDPNIHPMYSFLDYPFFHGVAAGDSRSDGFILWTKLSPKQETDSIKVFYFISLLDKKYIVKQGVVFAHKENDFVIKLNVSGLKPFTKYLYWFKVCSQKGLGFKPGECKISDIGKAKTTPNLCMEVKKLSFVVFTGSNYNAGYFNAYCAAAKDTTVDFVIHTGDYIYEYGTNVFGKNSTRSLIPNHELITFNDYNTRYWLYRMDTCLKNTHKAFAWYTIWDDHEVANDAWKVGADNHQPSEGNYFLRRQNAFRAYYQWIPIKETEDTSIFRVVKMGNLVRLILLDTRHFGRDYQKMDPWDSSKTMLGQEQLNWFFQELIRAQKDSVKWILVAQQLLFAPLIFFNDTINRDGWDMYPLEREKILRFLYENNLKNVVFLGGDFHTSWANELYLNAYKFHSRHKDTMVSMEFITPSITSPAANGFITMIVRGVSKLIRKKTYIRYVDLHHKGYMKVIVLPEKLIIQWINVRTIKKPDNKSYLAKTYIYTLKQ